MLTKAGISAIINKLSKESGSGRVLRHLKIFKKRFKKGIDKPKKLWYNNQVASSEAERIGSRDPKKILLTLDKSLRMWYNESPASAKENEEAASGP